jgi:hypothetical protein
MFAGLAKSRHHARMILSGIHDFDDLEAGFPTKMASGMTFCEAINVDAVDNSNCPQ